MTTAPKPASVVSAGAVAARERTAARAATAAFWWAAGFTALHGYWYLGGRIGFGDQPDPLPGPPTNAAGWIFDVVVLTMFVAGLVVPLAVVRPWGARLPRRLLVRLLGVGAVVLLLRGGSGLVDDALRFTGLVDGGLTGLSSREVLGSAHPSTYTQLSTIAIDAVFVGGGLLFARAARLTGRTTARGRSS